MNPSAAAPLPPLRNAYLFASFNALSYQMILGSPMILYAKSLDASATVLGIIAGMMPLLVVFQIPAARHIARVGHRRFVLAGWGTRVMFIFLMALVPLTGRFLAPSNQVALLLFLLFGFNLSRGISSAAWLPWMTALVPAEVRGQYLARDSACVNGFSSLTLLAAGLVLGSQPKPWQFATVFAYSALTGLASLGFLRRIPDVPTTPPEHGNPTPVPWKAIAAYPPFRKLLRMNIAWSVAYGGLAAFTVAYLKTAADMKENWILFVTAFAHVGGLGGLLLFGSRLDRYGSKPVLMLTLAGWMVVVGGWTLLSGAVVPLKLWIVLFLELCMGLGYAVFSMANTRLAMATVLPMGREHFFALFSVVGNLSLGISPIVWGLLIDAFGARSLTVGLTINRFSLFFLLVSLTYALTVVLCRRLEEPQAANVAALVKDFLAQNPLRSWIRFWPRG